MRHLDSRQQAIIEANRALFDNNEIEKEIQMKKIKACVLSGLAIVMLIWATAQLWNW